MVPPASGAAPLGRDKFYMLAEAFRQVGEQILQTTDPASLARFLLSLLTESLGYRHTWISLSTDPPQLAIAAPEADPEALAQIQDDFRQGRLPLCGQALLSSTEQTILRHPETDCRGCPLRRYAIGWQGVTLRLEYRGQLYGLMAVVIPAGEADTTAEMQFIEELGRELAFALDRLHLEREHHRSSRALSQSEARFRALVGAMDDIIFTLDRNQYCTGIYGRWPEHYGYTPETLLGKTAREVLGPDAAPVHEAACAQALSGRSVVYEWSAPDLSGRRRHIQFRLSPIFDAEGQVQEIVGVGRDITDLKETSLAATRLGRILDDSLNEIYLFAADTLRLVQVNRGVVQNLGYSPEEIRRLTPLDIWAGISPEELEKLLAPLRQGQENRRRLTIHHRRKDGSTYPVELHLQYSTLGEQPLFVAFAQDITSRWQMEQQLIRRNRELDLLNRIMLASFSNPSPNIILQIACRELTRTFDLPYVNAAIIDETGQRAEFLEEYGSQTDVVLQGRSLALEEDDNIRYLLSQSAPLRLDNAARHPRLARYHHLLAENRITTLYVFPLIAEGQNFGSLNLCLTKDSRFEDADVDLVWRMAGQVAAVIARTRLVEQHRRLGVAIEQAAESVVMTDLAGSIIYVNPAFERITGYSREEAIGQNPRILKSGKQDAAFYRHLWSTITAGKVWHGRFVNKKKTGELYTEEATITPVRSEAGEIVGYVAVKRDITHELQLEEQFHQAQKMEALGRLTGGVAHDFNNLLTAINGFAELMKLRVKPDDPLYPMLNNILKSGEKATRLVQHLLTFSRKQVTNPRVVDLNAVVQDMEKLLRRIIGEDIHLTVRLSPDVYPVYIDPTQMEQVLMNLVVNARDTMPKGGKLTIETTTADLDEAYTADHLEARPGKHTVLAVSDSGSGIPDDVLPHIFEPFFTTKSGGTGLGLATVYGIVRQNGGHITVYSETGIGTTFKIYLPYAAIPQPEVSTPTARETMIPTGKETILLVEDNNDVRILAEQALQSLGYTLLVAQNGEEAVQLAAAYPGHIDLLLTDVVMPGLSGPELAEQLQASRPGLKVIFMSGYTEATVARHGILDDRVPYVQKPFSPTVIAYKIREVLDAPA